MIRRGVEAPPEADNPLPLVEALKAFLDGFQFIE